MGPQHESPCPGGAECLPGARLCAVRSLWLSLRGSVTRLGKKSLGSHGLFWGSA